MSEVARDRAVTSAEPDHRLGTSLLVRDVELDVAAHRVRARGCEVTSLAPKEFALLRVLLANAGRVVSRGQLVNEVWGEDFQGDPQTLDVHVLRLRRKLEIGERDVQYIRTVRGRGYVFDL